MGSSSIKIKLYGMDIGLEGLYSFDENSAFTFGVNANIGFTGSFEYSGSKVDLDKLTSFSIAPYVGIAYLF